jgi:hypothetical protein
MPYCTFLLRKTENVAITQECFLVTMCYSGISVKETEAFSHAIIAENNYTKIAALQQLNCSQ